MPPSLPSDFKFKTKSERCLRGLREEFASDCYGLAALPDNLSLFLDIGCCDGSMSWLARSIRPSARVFCVDPDPEHLANALLNNTGACGLNMGLGDGRRISKIPRGRRAGFGEEYEPSDDGVPTASLSELFRLAGGSDGPYAVKIDCEGGESCLVNPSPDWDVLKGASLVALEAHPAPWAGIAEASAHKRWLADCLGASHGVVWLREPGRVGVARAVRKS